MKSILPFLLSITFAPMAVAETVKCRIPGYELGATLDISNMVLIFDKRLRTDQAKTLPLKGRDGLFIVSVHSDREWMPGMPKIKQVDQISINRVSGYVYLNRMVDGKEVNPSWGLGRCDFKAYESNSP